MRLSVLGGLFCALCGLAAAADAQLVCDAGAVPAQVRVEGLSEKLGEIVLTCTAVSGDTANGLSLSLLVSSPVTNRLMGDSVPDVVLTADTATGHIPVGGSPRLLPGHVVSFAPFTELPANGRTTLRVSNALRR
jgi:hypothetical protein